ncbi:MAG: HEAT repeat domain-containing protein, partial [Gemmatimonadota bacterium]
RTLESSVEAIARTRPEALSALIDAGPGDALAPAIALAARLGLAPVVPAIVKHLQSGDIALRLVAIRALSELGTPTAVTAIEGALADPERSVRQAALTALMARGGSGGLMARLEAMLFGAEGAERERSERRALFEAYGALAGPAAIPRLREIFEPRGLFRRRPAADVLASALFSLARIATPEARLLVEQCVADKDPVVRGAANAVLRDWPV